MAKKQNTAETAERLAQPVLAQMGLALWDVAYEKEGSAWFLRYYIDKDGGVTLNDCEDFSHAVEALLDEADPIEGSYTLEVSSPGIERKLSRDSHYAWAVGKPVTVRLIRPDADGVRERTGTLRAYAGGALTLGLSDGAERVYPAAELAWARLYNDYGSEGAEK